MTDVPVLTAIGLLVIDPTNWLGDGGTRSTSG
jgi:hypothetical protein